MLVADIAWKKLTPAKRARVDELLKLNPDYATWTAGVPASRKAEYAFMRASKWADDIKSRTGYTGGDADEQGAAGGQGYDDKRQHRYWHFKDIPFSNDGTALEQPYAVNAATQIEAFRSALGSKASDEVKSYDLAWLIHLVGDMHQPLHATTRFSQSPASLRDGDKGGNEIKIKTCSSCSVSSLHSYWDGALGTSDSLPSIRTKAAGMLVAPTSAANNADVDAWVDQSFALAKSDVYKLPIKNGAGTYVLTTSYKSGTAKLAKKRASLAGARLAKLIEDNLQ